MDPRRPARRTRDWSTSLARHGAGAHTGPRVAKAVALRVLTERGVAVDGWADHADLEGRGLDIFTTRAPHDHRPESAAKTGRSPAPSSTGAHRTGDPQRRPVVPTPRDNREGLIQIMLGELLLAPLRPVADVVDLAADATAALGTVTVITMSRWLLPDTNTLPRDCRRQETSPSSSVGRGARRSSADAGEVMPRER